MIFFFFFSKKTYKLELKINRNENIAHSKHYIQTPFRLPQVLFVACMYVCVYVCMYVYEEIAVCMYLSMKKQLYVHSNNMFVEITVPLFT